MKAFKLASWISVAIALCSFAVSVAQPDEASYRVSPDADGIQRVAVLGGSYFFRPNHIVVQAGKPLEISVKMERGIVPHSFVLESAEGKQLADVSLSEEAQILRLNLPAGHYVFYCSKRFLGFKSHRERGMAGTLEAVE